MRRKPGTLLPLEADILATGLDLRRGASGEFHGFQLAQEIAEHRQARKLTAHGTLYKALGRLEDMGLLTSRWEDADDAAEQGRPRRKLYEVTAAGERALALRRTAQPARGTTRPGLERA